MRGHFKRKKNLVTEVKVPNLKIFNLWRWVDFSNLNSHLCRNMMGGLKSRVPHNPNKFGYDSGSSYINGGLMHCYRSEEVVAWFSRARKNLGKTLYNCYIPKVGKWSSSFIFVGFWFVDENLILETFFFYMTMSHIVISMLG